MIIVPDKAHPGLGGITRCTAQYLCCDSPELFKLVDEPLRQIGLSIEQVLDGKASSGDVTLFDQRPKSRLSVNSGNCSGHGFPLRHGADPMNMGG
ncbi:hypothetical protein GOL25_30545 [Sinorhizobium medicae]|nr:hypothetical protein [Sinorhizobium medicae]MDX1017161.1 hypothetical protein [Sinorhizobium medicae]